LCRILNNEIYVKVQIGSHLSFEFEVTKGLRQGGAVVASLFDIMLETAIRSPEVDTRGTKFVKCSQIMAYADDVTTGRRLQDVEEVLTSLMNEQIRWDCKSINKDKNSNTRALQ
jgi:hypothetical protein